MAGEIPQVSMQLISSVKRSHKHLSRTQTERENIELLTATEAGP